MVVVVVDAEIPVAVAPTPDTLSKIGSSGTLVAGTHITSTSDSIIVSVVC